MGNNIYPLSTTYLHRNAFYLKEKNQVVLMALAGPLSTVGTYVDSDQPHVRFDTAELFTHPRRRSRELLWGDKSFQPYCISHKILPRGSLAVLTITKRSSLSPKQDLNLCFFGSAPCLRMRCTKRMSLLTAKTDGHETNHREKGRRKGPLTLFSLLHHPILNNHKAYSDLSCVWLNWNCIVRRTHRGRISLS